MGLDMDSNFFFFFKKENNTWILPINYLSKEYSNYIPCLFEYISPFPFSIKPRKKNIEIGDMSKDKLMVG
jgi:hypothetical protein